MKLDLEGVAVTLVHGDCLEAMKGLPDCSVDAIVTDPPAGIAFMSKEWDRRRTGSDGNANEYSTGGEDDMKTTPQEKNPRPAAAAAAAAAWRSMTICNRCIYYGKLTDYCGHCLRRGPDDRLVVVIYDDGCMLGEEREEVGQHENTHRHA